MDEHPEIVSTKNPTRKKAMEVFMRVQRPNYSYTNSQSYIKTGTMKCNEARRKLMEVIQRKHLAHSTGRSYGAWLGRYCDFVKTLPSHISSEQKVERFLTVLAQKDVAASTQNQAFNALLFFYREVLGVEMANVQSLRAQQPKLVRRAPTRPETFSLLREVQAQGDFAASLAVRLLYG